VLNLKLYPIHDETTLALLRGLDAHNELRVAADSCFWLGSVSRSNEAALRQFLRAAEDESLTELLKHAAIDDSLASAMLVRDAILENRFHLFIIESAPGLWADPRFVFGKRLSQECVVQAKEESGLPVGLAPSPKTEFWKAFVQTLIPRPLKAFFSCFKRSK
jgi:hypothetical protein